MKSDIRIGNIDKNICVFSSEDVVLDAGTGRGLLLNKLSNLCSWVYAIDINIEFIRSMKYIITGDNIRLLQADVSTTPFKAVCFNKVLCVEVLEHIRDPLIVLWEFNRIMEVGGLSVIGVPTWSSEKIYSRLNPDFNQNNQQHISILKQEQWLSLFRRAGFEIITIKNENFRPAIYWIWRSLFPIRYDPSSGEVLEKKLIDKVFWFVTGGINKVTFGGFNRLGNKIFPKSWYFYLRKTE